MRWEALFEDLEGQFSAAEAAGFEGDVASLAEAERGSIALSSRVAASAGAAVGIVTRGGHRVSGQIVDAANEWLLVEAGAAQTLVPLAAIAGVTGLSSRATESGGVRRRLGLGHALRGLARERATVRLTCGPTTRPGQLISVGHDFVDFLADGGPVEAVPISAIEAVASSRPARA